MNYRFLSLAVALSLILSSIAIADDKIDFEKQIQPILIQHCGKCHGAEKDAGKMRLHTAAALKEKWDADKELLVAGDPEKSEFYQRLVLPADDKKRMPKGADPLPKDVIDLIGNWIKQGAVLGVAAAPAPAPTEKPAEPAKAEPAKLPEVAAAQQAAIDKLTAAGARVMPLSADSKLLDVSFAQRSEPAGDAEVALIVEVADQVYNLNLADSKATAAGLAPLATLKNLNALHLERSAVTDDGLAPVAGLANLEYLNVYGTGITDAGLKHIEGLKKLKKLYLWQTKASYDAAMALEKATPGLAVNLGFDHPVVAKMRVTKELEVAKKQVEETKAEAEKAKQLAEKTAKDAEAAGARVGELEKQLKELETGAPAPTDQAAATTPPPTDPAAKEAADKATAEKIAADKTAAEAKVAAEAAATAAKAAADKAAAEEAAAQKAAADAKAVAEKAAADAKAAADKAAADAKVIADKAAADAKAATDTAASAAKAAADKAAAAGGRVEM